MEEVLCAPSALKEFSFHVRRCGDRRFPFDGWIKHNYFKEIDWIARFLLKNCQNVTVLSSTHAVKKGYLNASSALNLAKSLTLLYINRSEAEIDSTEPPWGEDRRVI